MLPLTIFAGICFAALVTLSGILGGIFGFTCILEEMEIDYNYKHVIVGILLLPFTLIFLVAVGIKFMFDEETLQSLQSIFTSSWKLFKVVVLNE